MSLNFEPCGRLVDLGLISRIYKQIVEKTVCGVANEKKWEEPVRNQKNTNFHLCFSEVYRCFVEEITFRTLRIFVACLMVCAVLDSNPTYIC